MFCVDGGDFKNLAFYSITATPWLDLFVSRLCSVSSSASKLWITESEVRTRNIIISYPCDCSVSSMINNFRACLYSVHLIEHEFQSFFLFDLGKKMRQWFEENVQQCLRLKWMKLWLELSEQYSAHHGCRWFIFTMRTFVVMKAERCNPWGRRMCCVVIP